MVTKEFAIDVFKGDSQSLMEQYKSIPKEIDEALLLYEKVDPKFYYEHFLPDIAKKLDIESLKDCPIELRGAYNHVACIQYKDKFIQFYVS